MYLYCILISNEFNYNYSTKLPEDVLVGRASQRTVTYGFRFTLMWEENYEFQKRSKS